MGKVSGIYLITCRPPGRLPYYYVGQSVDIDRRRYCHFERMRCGKHHNRFVQRCFDKHGVSSFTFEVLETCSHAELDEREDWWLSEMTGRARCMNLSKDATAPFRGRPLSEEHKAAISLGGRGQKRSDSTKKAISAANTGNMNSMFGKTGNLKKRSRPVLGISCNDGSVIQFESANLAMNSGFDQGAISPCCYGKQGSHNGYRWRFAD